LERLILDIPVENGAASDHEINEFEKKGTGYLLSQEDAMLDRGETKAEVPVDPHLRPGTLRLEENVDIGESWQTRRSTKRTFDSFLQQEQKAQGKRLFLPLSGKGKIGIFGKRS